MLSYMVPTPIDDNKCVTSPTRPDQALQLALKNSLAPSGRRRQSKFLHPPLPADSDDSSVSSSGGELPSVHAPTPTSCLSMSPNAEKPTIVQNGGNKHTALKRVSFGSSKGSMVETLIYETPLSEDTEEFRNRTPIPEYPLDGDDTTEQSFSEEGIKVPSNKVRVSFYTSMRPVTLAETNVFQDHCDSATLMTSEYQLHSTPQPNGNFTQHTNMLDESTDSGWENPFRPDGDLSKEADEIVERIKEGKPITPTQNSAPPFTPTVTNGNGKCVPQLQPSSPTSNGFTNTDGNLQVQVKNIGEQNACQAERVLIKKKKKCCVIQ